MIAVTGATGHSGRYFIDELVARDYDEEIRFLIRESTNTDYIKSKGLKATFYHVDLNDVQSIGSALNGVDTVLHIANIHYSIALVQAAIQSGVQRVILVHTTGIYSKFKMASEEYTEIETRLKTLEGKIKIIILRPTMIFGDVCDHNISKFIKMVDKLPLMPMIGNGVALIQPVNARDLGKAYYTAIVSDNIPANSYILSGAYPIQMVELFRLICLSA